MSRISQLNAVLSFLPLAIDNCELLIEAGRDVGDVHVF